MESTRMGSFVNFLRSCTDHTLLGVIAEGTPALIHSVKALTNRVALITIAQIGISFMLFLLYPNMSPLGFGIGILFDQQVSDCVKKVNSVFDARRTLLEKVLVFVGGGLLALLTMPMSLNMAAFYSSAQWGARFCQDSVNRHSKSKVNPQTPVPKQITPSGGDLTYTHEVDSMQFYY